MPRRLKQLDNECASRAARRACWPPASSTLPKPWFHRLHRKRPWAAVVLQDCAHAGPLDRRWLQPRDIHIDPGGCRSRPTPSGRLPEATNGRFGAANLEKPAPSIGPLWRSLTGRYGSIWWVRTMSKQSSVRHRPCGQRRLFALWAQQSLMTSVAEWPVSAKADDRSANTIVW